MMASVLVVDDHPGVVDLLCEHLRAAGYRCLAAADGPAALALAAAGGADLVVLDRVLPGMDGLEVCRRLRSDPRTARLPVLMLSGCVDEMDRIVGLEVGADDYVTKPFAVRELLARIGALLRRTRVPDPPALGAGALRLDEGSRRASLDGRPVHLSAAEWRALTALVGAAGRVVTREELGGRRHRGRSRPAARSVDTLVSRLRRRLGPDGPRIVAVRGLGYRLDP